MRKIMKICLLMLLYSIIFFLSLCFSWIYVNINVWFSSFEAISLATFFLLMCELILMHIRNVSSSFPRLRFRIGKANIKGYGCVV